MTQPLLPPSDSAAGHRAVLMWRPDTDESAVRPDVEDAGRLLGVGPEAVVDAINSGEMLSGWFVDWEITHTR